MIGKSGGSVTQIALGAAAVFMLAFLTSCSQPGGGEDETEAGLEETPGDLDAESGDVLLSESERWGYHYGKPRDVCKYHNGTSLAFDEAIVIAWVVGNSGNVGGSSPPWNYWAIVGPGESLANELDTGDVDFSAVPRHSEQGADWGYLHHVDDIVNRPVSAQYVCTSRAGSSILQQQEDARVHRTTTESYGKVRVYKLGYTLRSGEYNPRWLLNPCPVNVTCG